MDLRVFSSIVGHLETDGLCILQIGCLFSLLINQYFYVVEVVVVIGKAVVNRTGVRCEHDMPRHEWVDFTGEYRVEPYVLGWWRCSDCLQEGVLAS